MGTEDDYAKRAEYQRRIEQAARRSQQATDQVTRLAWEKLARQWQEALQELEEVIAFSEPEDPLTAVIESLAGEGRRRQTK
jgi:hypothetical protein